MKFMELVEYSALPTGALFRRYWFGITYMKMQSGDNLSFSGSRWTRPPHTTPVIYIGDARVIESTISKQISKE